MPFDVSAHRKTMLAHCISLIDRAGKEYALWAAQDYESKSEGVLQGLRARIVKEIEQRRMKGELK